MSEVENEMEIETNPIEDMIDSIQQGDFNNAESHFNDLIGDRLQDALDQAKVRVAQSIYNDSEIEDAVDEIEDDEEV